MKMCDSQRYAAKAVRLSLVLVSVLTYGCSSSESVNPSLFSPNFNSARGVQATRNPSAMEAISRGVAAVTPANAPLQDIYYQFDSTTLEPEAIGILRKNAEWLKANPKAKVEVEGHCDDVGSAEYNLALGAKRAQSARDFLVTQGIDENRLVTISYGKEAPACFDRNEECRVKNRRARFVIFTELPTS